MTDFKITDGSRRSLQNGMRRRERGKNRHGEEQTDETPSDDFPPITSGRLKRLCSQGVHNKIK